MENKKIFGQALDYQKTLFDNTFDIMIKLQDQGEQMIHASISNNPLIPDDSKKVCEYWSDLFKKNRDNYKSYIDTNYVRVKEMFKMVEPEVSPKKAEKKA